MVTDTSCLTHTGCGNNNFRLLVEIDHLGFITRDRHAQSRKTDWVNSLMHKIQRFLAETVLHVLIKDRSCLHCQRTIDKHREIFKLRQQMFRLDPSDKVKHLLRSSYGKCRDHKISTSCKGILQYPCKCDCIVRRCLMLFVTVRGLHYNIIRVFDILWIFDQWTIAVSDIPRKYNFDFFIVLSDPHLNAGRAKQMSCVHKPYL